MRAMRKIKSTPCSTYSTVFNNECRWSMVGIVKAKNISDAISTTNYLQSILVFCFRGRTTCNAKMERNKNDASVGDLS